MAEAISVLGLGLMGRPIAQTLLAAGYDLRGWIRSRLPQELVGGIPLCATLQDAARADVCLLSLADSAAVDAVLGQLESALSPGRLVIDMGTSDPSRSRTHAARLGSQGIGWVDAPVSGGPEGAVKGSLAIMAGGSESDCERARPILEQLGRVVLVGEAGAGHTMKIVNQVVVGLTIEAVAEALTLAEKAGLEPRLVQKALAGGFADSKILQVHGSRMIARTYTPGGKVITQLKDLELAQRLAHQVALRLPHLESAIMRYQALVAQGDGELDHSAAHKLLQS
jgi:3-hydroxyisobutyrate dehydrogenase-like beta-hydroxyacid dehydrogenase